MWLCFEVEDGIKAIVIDGYVRMFEGASITSKLIKNNKLNIEG